MTKLDGGNRAYVIFLLCAVTAIASSAQTLTTLASFDGTNGSYPVAAPIQGADGNFYGTTEAGGDWSNFDCQGITCGVVFKLVAPSQLVSLYSFCAQPNCADGATPDVGLTQASDLNFYGTTHQGGGEANCPGQGCGVVFKITPTGTMTTLYRFCSQPSCNDGGGPRGALIESAGGNLYGTTSYFGFNGGTIFKITRGGALSTLHTFAGGSTEGRQPQGELVQGNDGNFYGTTHQGGMNDLGTVFRMTPNGKLTTLYSFCSQPNCADGAFGDTGLVQASDGNFYGVTAYGGSIPNCDNDGNGCGTVFRITPSGTLTTLHSFTKFDGARPYAPLIQGTDGNLYGTTAEGGNLTCGVPDDNGCGTLFRITLDGLLTTLYAFEFTDGVAPVGLVQDTSGALYGATSYGGDSCAPSGCGTLFSLDVGLGPFVSFIVGSGKVGQVGGILGQGFTGTTSVTLDGAPMKFMVVSDTFLQAKIPQGATTGTVIVTTPSGVLNSNVPFHVRPKLVTFSPTSGPVGTTVTIRGVSLTQTQLVGFGDYAPAKFTVNSDTKVTATVPQGAKTGPVGIQTLGGVSLSSQPFTVTR